MRLDFRKKVHALSVGCVLLALPALSSMEIGLRQSREEAERFNPSAARRVLAELEKNPSWAGAYRSSVIRMIEDFDLVRRDLEGNDAGKRTAAVEIVAGWRRALLANPCLDCTRILCVRRKVDLPSETDWRRTNCSGNLHQIANRLGFMGLNAHNHIDMARNSMDNEIAVLEGFRDGTPRLSTLYKPKNGALVRDIDLDFDASRVLFTSWRGTNNLFGVYEVKVEGMKGSRVEKSGGMTSAEPFNRSTVQVSAPELISPEDGKYDVQWWDACYLPNRDQIVALGTGTYQFLPCEDGNMAMSILYRIDRKTGEILQLTFEQDSDYSPVVDRNGRVMYMRWEYSDLQHYFSRELMTMNPDGTGQLALWGSGSYFPTFFYGARCLPGDPQRLLMFAGGHHGRAEMGRLLVVDPSLGRGCTFKYDPPDRAWGPERHRLRVPVASQPAGETGLVQEIPGWGKAVENDVCDLQAENQFARGKPRFSYPWPLDDKYFLVTAQTRPDGPLGIYLADVFDNLVLIAEMEGQALLEPIPLMARERPPVQPDRRVKGAKTCTVHIADIYEGKGLVGVPRGTVKKLRVFAYHFNYWKTGGHVSVGLDRAEAGWDVKRVLGTVDVEADGSVCFEMPAVTPVSFQPLDKDGSAVQLMRSWTVGMPGERVSCTGCHEDNRSSIATGRKMADNRPIQQIVPDDAHGVRPWGFANEMWPQLRRYCLDCHGDGTKAPLRKPDQGGAENKGLRLVMDAPEAAYRMIHPYVRRPGAESELQVLNPLEFHASTSPLVQMLEKGHHGVRPDAAFMRTLRTWIDLNAPWRGKWEPPKTEQIARRLELARRWGGMTVDPEAEHDRRAAEVATQRVVRVTSRESERPKGKAMTLTGIRPWPMNANQAADAQLGAVNELAPVTVRTIALGGDAAPMTFRRIPAGTFVLGNEDGYPDERPSGVVTIARPFWMSETEVRNDQFHAFDSEHDSRYQDQYGFDQIVPGFVGTHRRQPAVRVTWRHAREFCAWLSRRVGVKADLPTEAQWEWAARAGTATPFPWGGLDDDFGRFANFADADVRYIYSMWDGPAAVQVRHPYPVSLNYPLHEERFKDDWFTINYVARGLPNAWGLYDMHGNAAEWTRTKYRPYPYGGDDRDDPSGDERRVVRGGSFASRPRDATSSFRQAYQPWQKVFDVGFRVVIEE